MSKPIAVLISDIHFTPATLELASSALIRARDYALKHSLPLVVAGDTLDGKAIIRGECANRLIEILSKADKNRTYMLVGNHDMINERGSEHSLNFLKPYVHVVEGVKYVAEIDSWLISYQNSTDQLSFILARQLPGTRLIIHQGVQTAFMGHYVQDKTSLPRECFAEFRVISGHYHRAQDIKCGRPRKGSIGLFSYIGSPYTTSFSEANDGPKGFRVLYDDGMLELIPLNLRKHVIKEGVCKGTKITINKPSPQVNAGDLVWLKLEGTRAELDSIDVGLLRKAFSEAASFKLEKICTDTNRAEVKLDKLTDAEMLDSIIDNTGELADIKTFLKALWREVL